MQQLRLFQPEVCLYKKFSYENIKATFKSIETDIYEVVLELNSNRFLIVFKTAMSHIEQFEIVAVKWFVEVTMNIVRVIRKIVYKLYFEI